MGLGRRECLVEIAARMRGEVVEHHANLLRLRIVDVDQVSHALGKLERSALLGDLDVPPGPMRIEENEDADWTTDLATFIDMVKAREPGLPVFLLGHSAGGVIACGYTLEHQDEIAGLICEDFAYQVPAPDIALAIVKGVSYVAPHAHVFKLKNEDFSRDPAVVAAMNADPLIANESQPSETMAEMVRADQLLKKSFGQFTLPLLILHGTADKVTKPSGSKEFYEKAGSNDKTLKLYEGHFHDLLADVGKQQVMADIQAWIDAHIGTEIPRSRRELRT